MYVSPTDLVHFVTVFVTDFVMAVVLLRFEQRSDGGAQTVAHHSTTPRVKVRSWKPWSSDAVLLWAALCWDGCRTSCIHIPKENEAYMVSEKSIERTVHQRKLLRSQQRPNNVHHVNVSAKHDNKSNPKQLVNTS